MNYKFFKFKRDCLFALLIIFAIILFFGASQSERLDAQDTNEDNLYTIALGAYKNGFLDIAIDQFQEFLKLYPNSPKAPFAWFRIGEACRVQNRVAIAEIAYQKVTGLSPGSEIGQLARFRLSGLKFTQNDLKGAISGYQDVIKANPSNNTAKESRFWLAESLYQSKRYSEALAEYRTFIRDLPAHKLIPEAMLGEGWCLFEMGKYKEAIGPLKKVLQKGPSSNILSQAYLKIGDAYFELHDYNAAALHYSKYIEVKPDDMHIIVLKQGYSLLQSGRYDDAINLYKHFLKSFITADRSITKDVLFHLGEIYYKQNNYKDAIETLLRLRNEYKGDKIMPETLYLIANSYLKMDNEPEAAKILNEIINRFPNDQRANHASLLLGNIAYAKDNINEAIPYYKRAASSKDKEISAEACYRLAESFLQTGDKQKAIQGFHAIETSHPTESKWIQMGSFRLGNIYEQNQELDRSLKAYEKVVNIKGGIDELKNAAHKRIEILTIEREKGLK